MIFFDNASTTKVIDKVALYISEVSKTAYGNPSSLHKKGREVKEKIYEVRKKIALSLSNEKKIISPDEIFFCASATEANNIAINSINKNSNFLKGKSVLYDELAHPSITEPIKSLEKYFIKNSVSDDSFLAKKVNTKDGFLDTKIYQEYFLDSKNKEIIPSLISLNEVNSETGAINDIGSFVNNLKAYIGKEKKSENNIKMPIIHIDGTQSYLKKNILKKNDTGNLSAVGESAGFQDLDFNDIDFYTLSSHKVNGPKGLGIIYFNGGIDRFKKLGLNALIKGGNQEGGLRSATESTELILGFGHLLDIINKNELHFNLGIDDINFFKSYISKNLKNYRVVQDNYSSHNIFLPLIINLITPYPAEVFVNMMSDKNVYISEGFACSSKKKDISKSLLSLGLSEDEAKRTVRISFGIFNKKNEIDEFLDIIKEI